MAPVAQPMLRVLLGLLGIAGGRVVSAEALIHDLWADDWSEPRHRNLHSQVSGLRRRLEEAEPGRGRSRLLRTGGGYRLELDEGALDAQLFEALTLRGRRATRAGDMAEATDQFGQALALWRGAAMADAAPCSQRLAAEAARLESIRAEAIEEQLECDLALGRHGEAAGRLTVLVSESPFRERLAELLMVALWRCGRRGEALAVFDRARRALADDLGLDPGPGLRDMHARVLADEPSLALAKAANAERAGPATPLASVTIPKPVRARAAGSNLPTPPARFIGRTDELSELRELLRRHRLVTIIGPGGAGKTRLAIELAVAAMGGFCDGVWFVDLAELSDPHAIAAAVAGAVGMRPASDQPVEQLLSEHVASLNTLLVVDNCEHVVDSAAAIVERLTEAGPDVHVIATSRQPLGLPGENVWLTPPIAFPPPQHLGQAADLAAFDAVRLFLDRAGQLGTAAVGLADLRVIAEITAAVDGLPLAIELAAARAAQLDLRQLALALQDRIGLSLLASRTAHARQRTLETTIGWSYDLLTPELQGALRRLSVFSGSFTVEAADAVTGNTGNILEVLTALAERCLIALDRGLPSGEGGHGAARYRMLETIRQYCASQILASDGPAGDVAGRAAHCKYFADLARRASQGLTGRHQGRWLSELEADYANLTAALNYLLVQPPCTADALQMIVDLNRFWHNRGHLSECVALIRRGLASADAGIPVALRSAALSLAGQAALKFDLETARSYFTAALELAGSADDQAAASTALWGLSWVSARSGDLAGGREYAREAVDLARAVGDLVLLGECLLCVSQYDDDPQARAACYAECLAVTSRSGDRIYAALVHNNFGNYALAGGDLAGALPHFDLAQAILHEIGAPSPWPVLNRGWVHLRQGDLGAADAAFTEALTMSELHHLRFEASYPILGLACSAATAGQPARAACILGFADAEFASCGAAWPEPEASYRAEALGTAQRELGAEFDRCYKVWRSADRADLIDYALGRRQPPGIGR